MQDIEVSKKSRLSRVKIWQVYFIISILIFILTVLAFSFGDFDHPNIITWIFIPILMVLYLFLFQYFILTIFFSIDARNEERLKPAFKSYKTSLFFAMIGCIVIVVWASLFSLSLQQDLTKEAAGNGAIGVVLGYAVLFYVLIGTFISILISSLTYFISRMLIFRSKPKSTTSNLVPPQN